MIIKKLRLQRGWSQEQLAELANLSVRTIQRIEGGQKPGLESLNALAAVFEVPLSTLQKEPDMTDLTTNEETLAFERVKKVKGFYQFAIRSAVILVALAVINFLATPEKLWVIWPAMGLAIAVLFHGFRVFGHDKVLGADWEKRQVEKELGRKL